MDLNTTQAISNSTYLDTNTNKLLKDLTSELNKFKSDKSPEQLSKCQESLYNYMQISRFKSLADKQLNKYHWLKSSYSVDDLLQETYLGLSKKNVIDRLTNIECIDMYISTTIEHTAIDIKRLASNKPTHSIGDLKEIDPSFTSYGKSHKLQALDYKDWSVRRLETAEQEERLELINATKREVGSTSNKLMQNIVDNSLAHLILINKLRTKESKGEEDINNSQQAFEWLDSELDNGKNESRRLSRTYYNTGDKEKDESAARMNLLRERRNLINVLSSKEPLNGALRTLQV